MSTLDHPQVESSLEGFLKAVRPRLKAAFARYRIPPQDTEDILQQALMALIHHQEEIRDPEAWLLGTVRNKCLLYWREQRRRLYESVDAAVLEAIAEPVGPAQESSHLQHDLAQALERLPERCRSLLWMRYRQGYDPPELAERLGYSPSSISKVTTRCLAALTRHLFASGIYRRKVE
ncbi:MAG TPA: sigma-70 family RNA polymerase sigma factor [Thermoanaerobaculia bacterium]